MSTHSLTALTASPGHWTFRQTTLNGTGKISDCPKNAQYGGKVLTKIYAPVNISQIKKCIGRLNFE